MFVRRLTQATLVSATIGVFGYYQVTRHESLFYKVGLKLLHLFDPEVAHALTVKALEWGIYPRSRENDDSMLQIDCLGMKFTNPIGMAAGFDKQAQVMHALHQMGFGFVEVGSVCPKPQPGNPKPRVFRLSEDFAIINRYGFNSDGVDEVSKRLEAFRKTNSDCILGINLGKNKSSSVESVEDFEIGVSQLGGFANYLVVNVSSPNTPHLRNLQNGENLEKLFSKITLANEHKRPILIKIAPDLVKEQKEEIAKMVLKYNIDGIIVSNTTISRPSTLKSKYKTETGGLSGRPLKEISTQTLRDMYKLTNGKVILIGVGGISSGKDAYEKIKSGASLVQIYSSFVYEGPALLPKMKQELIELMKKDGYTSIKDAIGIDV